MDKALIIARYNEDLSWLKEFKDFRIIVYNKGDKLSDNLFYEVINLENKELSYGKTNFEHGGIIIASNNKYNHEKICLEIKAIIESYKIHPFCV